MQSILSYCKRWQKGVAVRARVHWHAGTQWQAVLVQVTVNMEQQPSRCGSPWEMPRQFPTARQRRLKRYNDTGRFSLRMPCLAKGLPIGLVVFFQGI